MHWGNYYSYHQWMFPFPWGFLPFVLLGGVLLAALFVWSLVWKGLALWHAARRGEKIWFVVLLVVNTLGILEILYLYVFSKRVKSVEGNKS